MLTIAEMTDARDSLRQAESLAKPVNTADLDKFARICGMLGSSHDGERKGKKALVQMAKAGFPLMLPLSAVHASSTR